MFYLTTHSTHIIYGYMALTTELHLAPLEVGGAVRRLSNPRVVVVKINKHISGPVYLLTADKFMPQIQYRFYGSERAQHLLGLLLFVYIGSQNRKEMFYLTTHLTHFIYGYMASDIW